MKRFQKGQKVVCIAKDHTQWRYEPPVIKTYLWGFITRTIVKAPGPKFNEVVTCDGYKNEQSIYLAEYNISTPETGRMGWVDIHFEPLVSDEQLEEELANISTSVEQ